MQVEQIAKLEFTVAHLVSCLPREQQAAARDVRFSGATRVESEGMLEISGFSSPNRDRINGVFRRIPRVSGGFGVYQKTTDPTVCIWRVAGSAGAWYVGDTQSLGQAQGWAWLRSDAMAPETLGKGGAQWQEELNGVDGWTDAPNVRVRMLSSIHAHPLLRA